MNENTDTTTTEVPTEEKTFGFDARDVLKEYEQALATARKTRDEMRERAWAPLRKAEAAVRELIADSDIRANIGGLLANLSEAKRNAKVSASRDAYTAITEAATRKRDEALAADPFTQFVAGYITDNYGTSYADKLLSNAPFTFASLIELAHREDWCSDYEEVMKMAVRLGALPDDRVEVRRPVHWEDVPPEHGSKEGEVWERVFTVPAYVRTVSPRGTPKSDYTLRHYRSEAHYERVSPAPEPVTETASDS